jgi:hypothetical protein
LKKAGTERREEPDDAGETDREAEEGVADGGAGHSHLLGDRENDHEADDPRRVPEADLPETVEVPLAADRRHYSSSSSTPWATSARFILAA